MKQIKIKLLPNGYIDAETINYKGKTCQDILSFIKEITNSKVVDSEYKEEFYLSQNIELSYKKNDISQKNGL